MMNLPNKQELETAWQEERKAIWRHFRSRWSVIFIIFAVCWFAGLAIAMLALS